MPSLKKLTGALVALAVVACSIPAPTPTKPVVTPSASPTRAATSTPTITPSPSPTPTPLPETRVKSGDQAFWLGDYDTAFDEYQAAYNNSTDPDIRSAGLAGMGRIQHIRGDNPSAITSFQNLLDQFPDSPSKPEVYFWLGQVYTSIKRYTDAADAYAQYLALRPGVIDSYIQELRGDAFTAAGEDDQALQAYQASSKAPHLGDGAHLQIKIGQAYIRLNETSQAIEAFNSVYTSSSDDLIRSEADLYAGEAYLASEQVSQASERFLDAITNFPKTYGAYASLLKMVNLGMAVGDLPRGVVDYYAEQYQAALAALNRAILLGQDPEGTALYFKGLTLSALQDYNGAVEALDTFINKYRESSYWAAAWGDRADILWADLNEFDQAAQSLLDFVELAPGNSSAPAQLFDAGRIYERENKLQEAATVWEKIATDYPSSNQSFRGLFFAGVCRFRLNQLDAARQVFERAFLLATAPSDQAAALLWIGKAQQAAGDTAAARTSWQQAATRDPTGYYSVRALDLIGGRKPFQPPEQYDFGVDLNAERSAAETWMRSTFALDASTDLSGLGSLASDPRVLRGTELWNLGQFGDARSEFEAVRVAVQSDPVGTYQLMNYFSSLGLYRSSIYASRQVLSLAHLDDAASMTAPAYFNHIRFGAYYRGQILQAAQAEDLDPLFLFSVIRLESMFEGFATSEAGAQGLMQIMPATAQEVVSLLGWPPGFTGSDVYRPVVSIRLGSHYLASQVDAFLGDLYAALAAYNGGPANASAWKALAGDDPDLFLETVRIQQTRTYIMVIYEIYSIYSQLYSHNP